MKKPKINMTVVKEDQGYSATSKIRGNFIGTQGDNFEELKNNVLEAVNLAFEESEVFYGADEIKYTLDLASFFNFYKVINARALSERIGMNQSLLAQYISGKKKPTAAQKQRILKGIHQIGKELSEIRFLM
jgi:hypothetical protein